jgi:hypothetical protein
MTLLSDISLIYRRDGLRKANKDAFAWYRASRDSTDDLSVVKMPQQKGYLEPGKIHIFTYNPKGKGVLDYYDKKPVVISLGRVKEDNGNYYDLGLNLNFIPDPYKWYILNAIRKIYRYFYYGQMNGRNSGNALLQARIKYKYGVLKQLLKKYGFSFAIRKYIPSRKSRVYVTSYESWINIAFLSIENFEGINYDDMIKKYKASKL